LQVQAADLAAAARFYGQFLGLELDDEPNRHDGNEALHYDLAWGDFASGDYMMLNLAQAEPGQHTTRAQIGITVEDLDAVHQGRRSSGLRCWNRLMTGSGGGVPGQLRAASPVLSGRRTVRTTRAGCSR